MSRNGTMTDEILTGNGLRHYSQTFHKIPAICNGQFNNCVNPPTRMLVRHGNVRGYCDSCMLDMVLQAGTVTIR